MVTASPLLAQLIDDYIGWFVDWHRSAAGGRSAPPSPPPRFAAWRAEALKSLPADQPAIDRLTALHDQVHTLVKLAPMKAPQGQAIEPKDDESVAAKYLEFMRELRRFERAFATSASDLDPLTGLRTRTALRQDLEREISRSARHRRPFCVVHMDIDHFKKINDTYGHGSGDKVLVAIGDHVSRNLRAHDEAYRYGGEEFLLCLKETDASACVHILERLRAGIEKMPVPLADGKAVPVTASFGVASCDSVTTPDALLHRADEALYRAKNEGRNRIVVG
jgi:diguanylate cyclase